MDIATNVFIAASVGFLSSLFLLLIWWFVATSWLRPAMMGDKYMDILVTAELANLGRLLLTGLAALPALFINTAFTILNTFYSNLLIFAALGVFASGSLVWNEYSPAIVETILVVRQCYVVPLVYGFLLPVFNVCVMFYDSSIPIVDFYVNLNAFYWYGFPIILFKCSVNTDIPNVLAYLSQVFSGFFVDLNQWVLDNPLTAEWNILSSLNAFGLFIDSLLPIFDCFCLILNPLWVAVDLWCQLPSLHATLNCLWNCVIRTLQLVLATLQAVALWILPGPSSVRPQFTNITLEVCCTLYSAGDMIEDTVFITLEMLWGVFVNPTLPPELLTLISQPYMLTLSSPFCSLAKVLNMTATVLVNIDDTPGMGFLAADGTGIQYLQFGFIADELKPAGIGLASLLYIFNVETQVFVKQLWFAVVDTANFVQEWIIGNVWFFIWAPPSDVLPHYPAPVMSGITRALNFLFYYFPNYWVRAPAGGVPITLGAYTYSSAFADLYDDTFLLAEATGNLVGLINNAMGCMAEHVLKLIITLVALLFNLISFFMTILTFQADLATSAHSISVKPVFQEMKFVSGCLGELVSQFGNCTATQNELQLNLFCCTGTLITLVLDTFISLFQQLIDFFLDVVTLPTGTIDLCLFGEYNPNNNTCVRIPNLAEPIDDINNALCALSCAVANIIPVTILFSGFDCVFAPIEGEGGGGYGGYGDNGGSIDSGASNPLPIVPCASVTTCIANVLCTILQVFTVPLTLLNQFFVQMIVGNPFLNLFAYLNSSGKLLFTAIGNGADALAVLIDCGVCAFSGINNGTIPTTNYCPTVFYTIMHYLLVVPFIALASSAGLLAFIFTRLTIGLISSVFSGGGFFGLQNFLVNALRLMGITGYGANFWLSTLFGRMGLWELGSIVNSVFFGVCDYLAETINLIIAEASIITLGIFEVPMIYMCCNELIACVPFLFKKRAEGEDLSDQLATYNEHNTPGSEYVGRKRQFPTDANGTVYLTPNTWIDFIVTTYPTVFNWPAGDDCQSAVARYSAANWSLLVPDQRKQLLFCVYKKLWFARTDNMSWQSVGNDTCNDAMVGTSDNDWRYLRLIEKSIVNDCIISRYYVDMLRAKFGIRWFPQDWSNFNRKVSWLADLFFAFKIYFQYMMDRSVSPTIVMTGDYQNQFAIHGLNTSFYGNLSTTDDVLRLMSQYHLVDYFAWNQHSQMYDAAAWLSTTFWRFVGEVSQDVSQMSGSFGDTHTDPSIYMSYSYTAGAPTAITDGLLMSLLSWAFNAISKFAATWSDPATLKKRDQFFTDVGLALGNVRTGFTREYHLMSIEWYTALRHNTSVYYGDSEDEQETREFMYEYEKSLNGLDDAGGRHSIAYRLADWWQKVEWPEATPIPNPRDGKFRGNNSATHVGSYYHTYIDTATGEEKRETITERIVRWTALVRAGTPESNMRVQKLTASYTIIKNQIFSMALKSRLSTLKEQYRKAETEAAAATAAAESSSFHADDVARVESEREATAPGPATIVYTRRYAQEWNQFTDDDSQYRVCQSNDEECLALRERPQMDYGLFRDVRNTPNATPDDVAVLELRIESLEREQANVMRALEPQASRITFRRDGIKLSKSALAARAVLHIDSLLDLTCTSNITFLCTECFYLDQLVGRVLNAIRIGVTYYTGGQYGQALTQSADFFAYEADPNANCRVGDAQYLPVRWPWAQYDNLRILGDDTPNKLRFYDIWNATQNIIVQYDLSLENSTLLLDTPSNSVSGLALTVIKAVPPFYRALQFFYNLIVFVFSPTGVADGTSSGTFIFTTWVVCDWNVGSAFNGLNKRFSIGESFFAFFVIFWVIMFLGILVFRVQLWAAVIGTTLSLMLFLFTYLCVTYNWAWLCWPGLPYQLMKDTNYFFVNTLFTRCDWFFSGPIIGSYLNSNCASCAGAQMIKLDQCSNYFVDIFDNGIFFLEYFAPGVIQWLRDTTSPLYIIYQIPAVNMRLNQFANVNFNDPDAFALYWSCAAQFTGWSNGIIGAFVFSLAVLFWPLVTLGLALTWIVIALIIGLFFLTYFILQSMFVMLQMQAFFVTGLTETTMSGSDGGFSGPGGDGSLLSSHRGVVPDILLASPTPRPSSLCAMGSPLSSDRGSSSTSSPTSASSQAQQHHGGGGGGRGPFPLQRPVQYQQHHTTVQSPYHLAYNQHTNGRVSFEGMKNLLARTRLAYFGEKEKEKTR